MVASGKRDLRSPLPPEPSADVKEVQSAEVP